MSFIIGVGVRLEWIVTHSLGIKNVEKLCS